MSEIRIAALKDQNELMRAYNNELRAENLRLNELCIDLRAENERLQNRVRQLVKSLDDQHGTPCEQIRHQQEVERLQALLAAIFKITSQPEVAALADQGKG